MNGIIRHWISPTQIKESPFGLDKAFVIWEDDTLQTLYSKCIHYLNLSAPIYIWITQGKLNVPLGLELTTDWTNWNANPWKAEDKEVPKATLKYRLKEIICTRQKRPCDQFQFNLVTQESFSSASDGFLSHYFGSHHIVSKERLLKQDNLLRSLMDVSTQAIVQDTLSYKYVSVSSEFNQPILLTEAFEKAATSKDIPLVQCILDASHNLYKVYQDHRVPQEELNQWLSLEKLPKTACLVAYLKMTRDTFGRLVCDKQGHVEWTVRIDPKIQLDELNVQERIRFVEKWCFQTFGKKIQFTPASLSVRVDIRLAHPNLVGFADIARRFTSVFHIREFETQQLVLEAKRAVSTTSFDNPTDYIKSRLNLGILPNDILHEVQELYGLTEAEANQEFTFAQTITLKKEEPKRKYKIRVPMVLIRCSLTGVGMRVAIEQAKTWRDIDRTLNYIRSCMAIWELVAEKQMELKKPSSSSSSESTLPSSSSTEKPSSTKGLDTSFSLSSTSSSSGGAGIFMNALQQADAELFKYPRYARDCGAPRQPIAITHDEKAKIDPKAYDSIIENYGSDKAHLHNYICPRIWCPKSRIALTQEKLTELDGKCPGPYYEEPVKLYELAYWKNDPNQEHHVGFIRSKDNPNQCLPCCFKEYKEKAIRECLPTAPPKKTSEPSIKPEPKKKKAPVPQQDTYLFSTPAPIDANRWGVIPQSLHEAFVPNVTYELCTKALSMIPCFVRRGIDHQKDSLLNAIGIALGYKEHPKRELIQILKQKMHPGLFMTLQEGQILRSFMEDLVPIEDRRFPQRRSFAKWLRSYPDYVRHFQLMDIVHLLESSEDIHSAVKPLIWRVYREVAIYDAYRRFWSYLESNERKSPQLVFDILRQLKIVLMAWEQDGQGQVQLQCPFMSDPHLLDALHEQPDIQVVMLLKDGDYYEPLEWKTRSGEGHLKLTRKISAPFVAQSATYLSKCPGLEVRPTWLKEILSLDTWAHYFLKEPEFFYVKHIILNPSLRITHLELKGGAWIELPERGLSIHYLNELLEAFIKARILYHEDLLGNQKQIRLLKEDTTLYAGKVVHSGCGFTIGNLIQNEEFYYQTVLVVPAIVYPIEGPLLRIGDGNAQDLDQVRNDSTKRSIAKSVLLHYDTFAHLLETRLETSKELIQGLRRLTLWKDVPEVVLEDGVQWMVYNSPWTRKRFANATALIGTQVRLPWYSAEIQEKQKSWIFSQNAMERGLPEKILNVDKSIQPWFKPIQQVQEVPLQKYTEVSVQEHKCQMVPLPSKWTQFRASSWSKYQVCSSSDPKAILNIFAEVAEKLHRSWNSRESEALIVQHITRLWGYNFVELANILDMDSTMLEEWNRILKKNRKKGAEIVEKDIKSMTLQQWQEFIQQWKPHVNELFLYYAAKLLKVNIFVIYERSKKYGGEKGKRGDVKDLALSSAFYLWTEDKQKWDKMPCIFFNKIEPSNYAVLIGEGGRILHLAKDLESDIRELLEFQSHQ